MSYYSCGEWVAELIGVHIEKGRRNAKVRKFAVKRGESKRFFCILSVIDKDDSKDDVPLKHVLAALDAYHGGFDERN